MFSEIFLSNFSFGSARITFSLFNFLAFLIVDSGTPKKDDDSLIAQLVGPRVKSLVFSYLLEILIFSLTDFIKANLKKMFISYPLAR